MTLQPSATFHLHSETATTGDDSQPWFATEANIISALSTIPRLAAFATSPSTVGNSRWKNRVRGGGFALPCNINRLSCVDDTSR